MCIFVYMYVYITYINTCLHNYMIDPTPVCSLSAAELCPQPRTDSAYSECRVVCIFPLRVNKPCQVLFFKVLQNELCALGCWS